MSAAPRRAAGPGEQTLLLCALIATAQMTWGAVVPVLPGVAERQGLGVGALGVLIAAFAVGRILANIPAGAALARLPARPYLSGALLALALVTAGTGWADGTIALLVLRLIAGALGGAVVTVGFAVLLRGAPPQRRGRVVAIATVVQLTGAAAGSVLGGVVLAAAGERAVFVCAAVPALLALAWDRWRPAAGYWRAPAPQDDGASGPAWAGAALPVLIGLVLVSFATFFARFAGEQGLMPVLAYEQAGLDPVGLGLALAAGTVASLGVIPVVGRWVDRGARRRLVWPAAVLGALALAALGGADRPWSFIVLVVLYTAATSALGVVPGVVTAERFGARRTGAVVGLTRTAGDAGAAAGPIVVLGVAEGAGFAAAALLLGAVFLVAGAHFALVLGRRAG